MLQNLHDQLARTLLAKFLVDGRRATVPVDGQADLVAYARGQRYDGAAREMRPIRVEIEARYVNATTQQEHHYVAWVGEGPDRRWPTSNFMEAVVEALDWLHRQRAAELLRALGGL